MLKRYFIRLNRSQLPQILVHPCEQIPFESAEAAELYVEDLKQKGEFHIFDHKIHEANTLPISNES